MSITIQRFHTKKNQNDDYLSNLLEAIVFEGYIHDLHDHKGIQYPEKNLALDVQ